MEIVDSISKHDLELLLNIIARDAARIGETLRSFQKDASDEDIVQFFSKQMESRANFIANAASQALYAWDMQEYTPLDGSDYDKAMKEAGKKACNFEPVQWRN